MREPDAQGATRADLLDRLKALDAEYSPGSLAELAYRRAREALEKALEEARTIRMRALEDARQTRDQEIAALTEALQRQRLKAESEIEALLRKAEIEGERIRSDAHRDAESLADMGRGEAQSKIGEAARMLEEAQAVRNAVEQRRQEMDHLEEDFNRSIEHLVERLGITEKRGGWFQRLTGKNRA